MFVTAIRIWQQLVQWDRSLFVKINHDWSNPLFDAVMPFLRNSLSWAPLYLFFGVLVLYNFRVRGLWWIIFFLVTVALTDLTGNYGIKHLVHRLRPCNDPEFSGQVRLLLDRCGAGYSFISNHAANHFGMATFFLVSFRPLLGRWAWLALVWASLIAYAQVYVGVHYPLDVLAGALLGLVFGILTGTFFNKRYGFAIFEH